MHEPWLDDPLGYLIGAERKENFFAHAYERDALVVVHGAPDRFAGLLSIDDIDRIVTTTDLRDGQLVLADASRGSSDSDADTTRTIERSDYVDAANFVDRGAVADLYRRGATIILNQAHQFDAPLARLCRGLEQVFSAHVQTNIYLTPANAQGFRTHYDNHDVLVIQVEGEKAWRLYDKPIDTPYRGENFEHGRFQPGALRQEFVLKAGDCAYVPRGLMHDASASGGAPSLHITIGLITRTWADLMLEAVSEAALRSPELRRSLPPGFARADFDRSAARAHLAKLANALAKDVQLDPALDLMVDTFIRSRGADNRGAISEASQTIGAGDRFAAHPRAPRRIAQDGDSVIVIGPGGELPFAIDARVALERALSGAPFTLADLNTAKPDAMVTTLLSYGLVRRL
ncbi:MAG: cupin domain-containing protein [Hyphomonadaceae bacterium]